VEHDRRTQILEDLHRRYAGAVYHKCLMMLSDRSEAEDAVQETYLKAYLILNEETVTDAGSRLPWLYAIARHVCLHALRTRRRKGLLLVEDTEASDNVQLGRLAARSHLAWLLGALDERDRRILASTFIDGVTQAESALRLGVSRRAVVKRIASMRARYNPWTATRPRLAGG
jgi:RNA polymerase sigma-70 factor (ECF subfamily)